MAASLVACETSFGLLALALAVVLLGNVISAVLRTEVVALGVGEPFGARVLALA